MTKPNPIEEIIADAIPSQDGCNLGKIVGVVPKYAAARVLAALDNAGLAVVHKGAVEQAFRQWKMYAELEDRDLATDDDPESHLWRHYHSLVQSSTDPDGGPFPPQQEAVV